VKAYFDFSILPLLLMRSREARIAATFAERFALPWSVNYLHLTQLENLFTRLQLEGNSAQRRIGISMTAAWRAGLAEGIFATDNPPWDDAWRVAIGFHRDIVSPVPQPSQLLHLAAARLSNATHYLCLHPPARQLAKQLGLHVLPETL
jgi:hypothetical protein